MKVVGHIPRKSSAIYFILVRGGVPQGSALGPLLFLVYVSEMSSHGKLLQYADDTVLICTGPSLEIVRECLSQDLSHLLSWIKQSKMRFNTKKSSVMWFQPRALSNTLPPEVKIDDVPFSTVASQKYLGITFDNKLDWSTHVASICKTMSFYLFWINSHRKSLPTEVTKMLVDSFVLSRLIYALPVWGPLLSQSNTHRLQRLHNWGVGITASLHKFDHVSEHRANFDWLSVSSLIKYRCLCALHKIYMGDGTMLDPPVVFGTDHKYHTRSSQKLIQPAFCRLSSTKKLFRHSAAHWWNDLPDEVALSSTFPSSVYNLLLCNDV